MEKNIYLNRNEQIKLWILVSEEIEKNKQYIENDYIEIETKKTIISQNVCLNKIKDKLSNIIW